MKTRHHTHTHSSQASKSPHVRALVHLVDNVVDGEAAGVLLGEGVELVLEQDVVLRNVGKHQCELRLVIRVPQQLRKGYGARENPLKSACVASWSTQPCKAEKQQWYH